jgi:hypothetical protein
MQLFRSLTLLNFLTVAFYNPIRNVHTKRAVGDTITIEGPDSYK